MDEAALSWKRCLNQYKIDQRSKNTPDILTAGEFHLELEPAESMLAQSREELNGLSAIIRPLGYAMLVANSNGIIIELDCLDNNSAQFGENGTRLGGIWSEEREGTNGIGTCLVTEQPLTVHRDQHFRTRHKMFSCSGAPVFDWRGRVALVLCLAACGNETADHSYAMAEALTVAWARIIEERLFREHFRNQWTIAIEPEACSGQGLMLAVDNEQRIVGADQHAKPRFNLNDQGLSVDTSLWSRFDRASATFKWNKTGDDTPIHLTCSEDASTWSGITTAPACRLARLSGTNISRLHTRPRLASLHSLQKADSKPTFQGGLTPVVCRRVLDYIDNNLDNCASVEVLATEAGLSIHHFSREFSRSVGETPHVYLQRRRLEKAAAMIEYSDQPLAEIALAVGFSDQSHFTRRFARYAGVTPGAFRRARR